MGRKPLFYYKEYLNSYRENELYNLSAGAERIFWRGILFFLIFGCIIFYIGVGFDIIDSRILTFMIYILLGDIVFTLVAPIVGDEIILKAKMRNPQKYFGGDVYKLNLYSITPNIVVYKDLSKEENIKNAERKIATELMVQNTINDCWYREIVTGKLIPKSEIIRRFKEDTKYNNIVHPVYTLLDIEVDPYDSISKGDSKVKKTDFEEVSLYMKEREGEYEGFLSFSEYLENIFNSGEEFYKNAREDVSDDEKIQKLLSA